MARALALGMALATMLLALACDGGEAPAPTASPPLTATPARTATPTPMATATPIPSPTASPVPTVTLTPTPSPTPTPFPTPTGPAVTVAGPLIVLSDRLDEGEMEGSGARERWVETRRVYVYDVATEQYWAAFDYRHAREGRSYGAHFSAVHPAGTSLIVWSDGQVRRVGLNGYTEAILFEHDWIGDIKASPDGMKVAITYGLHPGQDVFPLNLLVLDATTGAELLHVKMPDPLLAPLRDHWSDCYASDRPATLLLGNWHMDGESLHISGYRCQASSAILTMDGALRILPENWVLSPDLRYALQLGEPVGHHEGLLSLVWNMIEMVAVSTGNVLWTVRSKEGGGLAYYHRGSDRWLRQIFSPDSSHVVLRELNPYPDWRGREGAVNHGDPKIIDVETGEINALNDKTLELLEGNTWSTCTSTRRGLPCMIWHHNRIVWEGAAEWAHYIGIIDTVDALTLRGVTLRDVPGDPVPRASPAREEMEGPLLVYEVRGENEYPAGGGGAIESRRVMVYDEGTGRSWRVLEYPGATQDEWERLWNPRVQTSYGGLVALLDGGVSYLTPDGQTQTRLVDDATTFRVSPDGRKIAVLDRHDEGSIRNSTILVLEFLSGTKILHTTDTEFLPQIEQDSPAVWTVNLFFGENNGWTSDGNSLFLLLSEYSSARIGLLDMNGRFQFFPCKADGSSICFSPDARYIARGYGSDETKYTYGNWRHIHLIDFETDRVLWSLETAGSLQDYHWEWASPNEFAWSSGPHPNVFRFDLRQPGRNAEHAEVSVIDVETGEIEVMDSEEYLARFHPPSRATTDCPPNPAHACRILLDGEVVGEGRWPIIIGFIELDQSLP